MMIRRLTLSKKINLTFVPIIFLMVLMGGITSYQINEINGLLEENYHEGLVTIKLVGDTALEALRVRERLLLLTQATSLTEQERQYEAMMAHETQVNWLIDQFKMEEGEAETSELDQLTSFETAWADALAACEKVAQLTLSGQSEEANLALTGEAEYKLNYSIALLLLIQDTEDEEALKRYDQSQKLDRVAGSLVVGMSTVASSLALILGFLLSRTIGGRVATLATTANEIANGDLDRRVEVTSEDEIGILAHAFNQMTAQLRNLIGNLEQRVAERTTELEGTNATLKKQVRERQRAEKALAKHAAQLERSNRELERFAYIASHDLQEPLRKVTAFGSRLASRYDDVIDERGQLYLTSMIRATERMQELVSSLLDYSRVMIKAKPFAPVDLNYMAQVVVSDLEFQLEETGGQVIIGKLPTIEADPLQMRQLLQNLIGNALKFTRPDVAPVVQVEGQRLNGYSSPNGDTAGLCQITVTDNGIGFDEKYVDRIFDVFQRLHGRNKYEGTGIGLAICKKIVDRHEGGITAKSAEGKGSAFTITLPIIHSNGDSKDYEEETNHDSDG